MKKILDKMSSYHNIRKQYSFSHLNEVDLSKNPYDISKQWIQEAIDNDLTDPTAMALASVNSYGAPSVRIVLLKEIDENGFVFFTNYESRKAQDFEQNNNVSLLFFWKEFERQIRVEGKIYKLDENRSNIYFNSRPFGSKIAAIVSRQSEILDNYEDFKNKYAETCAKYKNSEPEKPNYWGAYIIKPHNFEFWQGGENRLHDRFKYTKQNDNQYSINRLYP